jgi:hypothetical protein
VAKEIFEMRWTKIDKLKRMQKVYIVDALKEFVWRNPDRLTLILFPLIFTAINSNWIFTPPTNNMPDPWFYFSYFRYFFERATTFPSSIHYFVERLTWVMPGYWIYRIFPPLAANHVLHLLVYYVSVLSLYGTLDRLFHRRAAFISALLLGGYPWFLRAVGWDYPDGVGIAYLCLLIFLLTLVFEAKYWKALFLLAGAVHFSLLVTNLFWLGFIPGWTVYFLLLNSDKRKFNARQLILAAGYFFVGNVLLAGVCALFYHWATGKFFFLENTLRISFYLVDNSANNIEVLTNYGGIFPWWHILPLIVFLSASATMGLAIFRQRRVSKKLLAAYWMFVLAYAWLVFWHYFSNPLLIVFPYVSLMIPMLFLLLGALWAEPLSRLSQKQYAIAGISGMTALLFPVLTLRLFPVIENLQGNKGLAAALGLAFLACWSIRLTGRKVAIFASLFFLGFFYFPIAGNSHVYMADHNKGRDNFKAIIAASDAIDSYDPNPDYGAFRLWFRADENYNTFFSLAAVYLHPWGSSLDEPVSSKKPHQKLSLSPKDKIRTDDRIVILSSSADADALLSEAGEALDEQRLDIVLESLRPIHAGNISFYLYFTRIVVAE